MTRESGDLTADHSRAGRPPGGDRLVDRLGTLRMLLGLLLLAAFALPLARRGLVLSDEGLVLQQTLDLLAGKVLYRDLSTLATPGVWLLYAALFSLLEPSVLAARLLCLAAYLAMAVSTFQLLLPLAGRSAATLGVALLAVFAVWAFPGWMLAWYSPFAICFAIAGIERLARWGRRRHAIDLFAAGVLLGLCLACKQNYGAFALAGAVAALALTSAFESSSARRGLADFGAALGALAAGALTVALPLLLTFAAQGALPDLADALFLQPLRFAETSGIPFLPLSELWSPRALTAGTERLVYGSVPWNTLPPLLRGATATLALAQLHALLYWAPVPMLATAVLRALRRADPRGQTHGAAAARRAVALCGAGLFLGVFPRADFSHLMSIYPAVIVVGVLEARDAWQARGAWRRMAQAAFGVGTVLCTACAVVAVGWYTALLRELDTEIAAPRGGVWVSGLAAMGLEHQLREIRARTAPGEALLTVPDLAMLNFLSERPQPSRYHEMYEHLLDDDGGERAVGELRAAAPRLALVRFDDFFSHRRGLREYAPALARYLRVEFQPVYYRDVENYALLERRAQPERTRWIGSALTDCDATRGEPRAERQIRSHLLFDSLFHRAPADTGAAAVRARTHCRLRVPPNTELVFEAGVRPPMALRGPLQVAGSITLASEDGRESLYHERYDVDPDAGSRPDVHEVRLDLAAYAGRDVTLEFESAVRGAVVTNPLDFRGFGVVWQDPHLEARDPEAGGGSP